MSKELHRIILDLPFEIILQADEISQYRFQSRKKLLEQIICQSPVLAESLSKGDS